MRTLNIIKLTEESFKGYGVFKNMLSPEGFLLGTPPGGFYRDMLTMPLALNNVAGFSISRALKAEKMVVNKIECHDSSAEAFIPLDGDIILTLGEATIRTMPPLGRLKAFYIPKGTMAVINPGVWHGAEFASDEDAVNVLTVLPERTYALDCFFYDISEDEAVEILKTAEGDCK